MAVDPAPTAPKTDSPAPEDEAARVAREQVRVAPRIVDERPVLILGPGRGVMLVLHDRGVGDGYPKSVEDRICTWLASLLREAERRGEERVRSGPPASIFPVGVEVEKVGGDYTFRGHVVAAFQKRSGASRFVVEDDRGVLHVYSPKNLRRLDRSTCDHGWKEDGSGKSPGCPTCDPRTASEGGPRADEEQRLQPIVTPPTSTPNPQIWPCDECSALQRRPVCHPWGTSCPKTGITLPDDDERTRPPFPQAPADGLERLTVAMCKRLSELPPAERYDRKCHRSDRPGGVECCRERHEDGDHVACDGERIVGRWPFAEGFPSQAPPPVGAAPPTPTAHAYLTTARTLAREAAARLAAVEQGMPGPNDRPWIEAEFAVVEMARGQYARAQRALREAEERAGKEGSR